MGKNTRYDRLRRRIERQFTRGKTFTPAIEAGGSELLFDLSQYGERDADGFLAMGPFNFVTVRNFSNQDIVVYPRSDRQVSVQIPASSNQAIPVSERIPRRYVSYLRIENQNGSNAISAGDVEVQVGREVDGVEYDLLEAGGMLDIPEESDRA